MKWLVMLPLCVYVCHAVDRNLYKKRDIFWKAWDTKRLTRELRSCWLDRSGQCCSNGIADCRYYRSRNWRARANYYRYYSRYFYPGYFWYGGCSVLCLCSSYQQSCTVTTVTTQTTSAQPTTTTVTTSVTTTSLPITTLSTVVTTPTTAATTITTTAPTTAASTVTSTPTSTTASTSTSSSTFTSTVTTQSTEATTSTSTSITSSTTVTTASVGTTVSTITSSITTITPSTQSTTTASASTSISTSTSASTATTPTTTAVSRVCPATATTNPTTRLLGGTAITSCSQFPGLVSVVLGGTTICTGVITGATTLTIPNNCGQIANGASVVAQDGTVVKTALTVTTTAFGGPIETTLTNPVATNSCPGIACVYSATMANDILLNTCRIAAAGYDTNGAVVSTASFSYLDIPSIQPTATCNDLLTASAQSILFNFNNAAITYNCFVSPGSSTCQGDFGAPIVCNATTGEQVVIGQAENAECTAGALVGFYNLQAASVRVLPSGTDVVQLG